MSDKQFHGFYEDMPNDDYHAADGISKTGLDKIERSPAHFKWPKPHNATRNMEIGTAIHAAILEPERFDKEYVIVDCKLRTHKDYKEAKAANKFGGEFTLTKPESVNVLGMRESAHSSVEVMEFLSTKGSKAELSAFVTDKETGVQIRSRYDWIKEFPDFAVCVDVKKCQDLRKFARSVSDYRYHVQDAMYSDVYFQITGKPLKFYFLAVEEESPHSCKIFELDDLAKEVGHHYYRKNLRTYAECVKSGSWPHKDVESVLELPNWEVSKYESDLEVFI